MKTRIAGLGSHLPERVVSNDELAPALDVTGDWIEQRCGIRTRRFAAPGEATSDLAAHAAREAMEDAGIGPEAVDALVLATYTPDLLTPGAAVFLQAKLGLRKVPVYDIRQMCTGFLYGLSIADRAIRCGDHSCVLLVGAEIHSKLMDHSPEGRGLTMLFGDGAGAVVLRPGDVGVGRIELHADGTFARALHLPAPGTANPRWLTQDHVDSGAIHGKMDGPTVFVKAIDTLSRSIAQHLEQEGLQHDDIALFVVHQANLRILERVAQRLGVPPERFHHTIATTGNTSAASLPLALADARAHGRLHRGERILLAAFGAGFHWGCTVVTW